MKTAQEALAPSTAGNRLARFAHDQLASLAAAEADVIGSTVGLLAVAAFFSGASEALAGRDAGKGDPGMRSALRSLMMRSFGLDEGNADGLIVSVARLIRRYRYLEEARNSGARAAHAWLAAPDEAAVQLRAFFAAYPPVSMAELGRYGMSPEPLPEAGPAASPTAPTAVSDGGRRGRWFWWMVIAAMLAVNVCLIVLLR